MGQHASNVLALAANTVTLVLQVLPVHAQAVSTDTTSVQAIALSVVLITYIVKHVLVQLHAHHVMMALGFPREHVHLAFPHVLNAPPTLITVQHVVLDMEFHQDHAWHALLHVFNVRLM